MPDQILPVTGLGETGLIVDTPAVSLPPNAFTGVENVRFRDGAINKMEGEVNIFPRRDSDSEGVTDTDSILKYIAWWPNPNKVAQERGYYLYIKQHADTEGRQMDHVYLLEPGDTDGGSLKGIFQPDNTGAWQHTLFQGGFAIIINNGLDTPHYILDEEGNTDRNAVPNFHVLPGWQNYLLNQVLLEDRFDDSDQRIFDFGQIIDFKTVEVIVEKQTYDAQGNVTADSEVAIQAGLAGQGEMGTPNDTDYVPGILPSGELNFERGFQIYLDSETNTNVMWLGSDDVNVRDGIRVRLRSRERIHVRAAVIRSFGDFLVAANLFEVEETDNDVIVRRLPGVVRTSDVAIPGGIPNNWNPYAVGVSTANEFTTTQSGIVQDMVQLQGNLYIYSNDGIFVMDNPRGNAPTQPRPVANGWGTLTTNAVQEFDGQHFVVGSQDIYIFGGHPGNIQSVADGRVRNYFYNDLNPFHIERMFVLRYQAKDEMWICYPNKSSIVGECNRALIWNYRLNNWTVRILDFVVSGDIAPLPGGGVPNHLIDLDGVSGDNGYVNIGAWEVQSFLMDSDDYLDGDSGGSTSRFDIRVQNLPAHNFTGRPIFDFLIPTGFSTGPTLPPYMTFTGFDTDREAVFNFSYRLPVIPANEVGTTVRDAITDFLHMQPEFDTDSATRNFNIIHTADNPREIVFEVLDTDVVSATIEIGARQVFDNASLAAFRTPANDVSTGDTETAIIDDTDGGTWINHTVVMDQQHVDQWFLPDLSGFPAGTRIVYATEANFDALYDPGGTRGIDSDHMFIDTEVTTDTDRWLSERPEIPGLDTEYDHYMYRARGIRSTDSEQTSPLIPRRTGVFDFQIRVPVANYDYNGLTFLAHSPPDTTFNGTNLGLLVEDATRQSFQPVLNPDQTLNTDNIPPIIEFTQSQLGYNEVTDMFTDSDNHTPIYVALGGDFTGNNRDTDAAESITHVFHDSAQSFFNATHNGTTSELISRFQGQYYLDTEITVHQNGTLDYTGVFTVDEIDRGLWPTRTGGTGRNAAIYPLIRVTSPEGRGFDTDVRIVNENANTADRITPNQILNQITRTIDTEGWTGLDTELNAIGYTRPATGALAPVITTNTYDVVTEAQRPVNGQFSFNILKYGNTRANVIDTEWIPNFRSLDTDTDISKYGYPADSEISGVTFRGEFPLRATPTYIGFLIYNSSAGVASNLETLILTAGGRGDYDPVMQTGTNGTTENPEPISERWQSEIRLASNNRISVTDRGTAGEFLLQPATYDDTATFVLEVALNDTLAGAARIQEFASGMVNYNGVNQVVAVNSSSVSPFINLGQSVVEVASNSPATVARDTDTQIKPDPARRPNRVTMETPATLTTPPVNIRNQLFDVDRPWPIREVNLNEYRPIFAQYTVLGDSYRTSKIVGADIGWTRPAFSMRPRHEEYMGTQLTIDSDSNDAPMPYLSFAFRGSFPISPEFETETIKSLAVWAEGHYKPSFFSPANQYNRVYTVVHGNDVPGGQDVTSTVGETTNIFNITEDYKIDHRVNARFMNILVGDGFVVGDRNPADTVVNNKMFSQISPWRVSGIQFKIIMGGKR